MPNTAAAAHATNGEDDNEDVKTAQTPAASNPTGASKTPVSSGGMTMRSGKKKKRSAFTATTPSRKRANKRSATDVDGGGGKAEGGGAAKKRRLTKVTATVDGEAVESDDSDEDMVTDDDEGSDNDVEMENSGVATATKVRFETTKEAVAAAQLPESDNGVDEESEEGEDEEEDVAAAQAEAEARAAAAAAANEQAAGWRRLLTQRLRLPSQHTPGPAATVAEAPGLPPPAAGGRRLIFDTGVKNKANGNTEDATATSRNKLLMQTRTKNGTKTSQSLTSKATSSNSNTSTVQQPTPSAASPQQNYPLFLLEELSKNHELKRDMIKCTMAWFAVLLVFFTLGNVTNIMGEHAWNVRQQSVHWSEWYGLTTIDSVGLNESNLDSVIAEASTEEEEEEEEEIVTIVDPDLLQQAKAMLRAQRMNQHDIHLFENITAEAILAMKMLDSAEDELIPSSPSLASSSVPAFSSSTTDPDEIAKYIASMIDTQDVLIFSKSYCPYCKETKALFRDMGVQPTVLELDEMENGSLVQDMLSQMTAQDTVPNVFVKGDHVGGNDDTQQLAQSGELQQMLDVNSDDKKEQIKSKVDSVNSNIGEKQQLLEFWEHALAEVEAAIGSLEDGSASQNEVNAALRSLSEASMVTVSAAALDVTEIHVPGEGCKGKDYVPLATGKEHIEVDVVGGVDVDALDVASDAPLLLEDAQNAYDSLVALAQSTSETLVGPTGPSAYAQQWAEKLVKEECQKEGVDGLPSVQIDLPNKVRAEKAATPSSSGAYNARAAIKDIDRLLEVEDADRTGKFDYASAVHGARVLRRGPRATSLSLYESLPLINRVLAYTNLRFYGHPPEVALRPTTALYAKGHCWSFGDEFSDSRSRHQTQDGLRGEYATLTVALSHAVTVTEVMIDHAPRSVVDGKSALKAFRVVGYEDIGAFGEPWELGSFEYDSKLGLQAFAIPTSVGGTDVPKLKALSLAIDSNQGAEYSCLYRFRVHGV